MSETFAIAVVVLLFSFGVPSTQADLGKGETAFKRPIRYPKRKWASPFPAKPLKNLVTPAQRPSLPLIYRSLVLTSSAHIRPRDCRVPRWRAGAASGSDIGMFVHSNVLWDYQ